MHDRLCNNWVGSTDGAENGHCAPFYVASECKHGHSHAHCLSDALACGLLLDVRKARGMTQAQVAAALGVTPNAVPRWERGEQVPRGLYRQALEAWLLDSAAE